VQRLAEARLVQGIAGQGVAGNGHARRDAGSSALAAALFQVKLGSVLCLNTKKRFVFNHVNRFALKVAIRRSKLVPVPII